uniref:dihydrofolate reductase n=1 Tax=Graphocephala atropunctata TaxID=36148 RepID=A0A1B6LYE2_9HEMI
MNTLKCVLPLCVVEMPDPPEIQLNVIAAVDRNMGIGKNNVLPWNIPSEFEYFHRMTAHPRPGPNGEERRNAVVIGRKTWETMDQLTSKPFPNSLNIVLSRDKIPDVINIDNTIVCESLDSVVRRLQQESSIDQTWVLGGGEVYHQTIRSRYFHRLYLTRIDLEFDCDSYFPPDIELDGPGLRLLEPSEVCDSRVPQGLQSDPHTGIHYQVFVYERSKPNDMDNITL